MNTIKRVSMAGLLAVASFAVSAVAFAQPGNAEAQCEGKHGEGKGKGGLFKRADKNADGFLTQAEVGNERWERLKVADANKDNKVSRDEMKQARKDGKLPKGHGKAPKA